MSNKKDHAYMGWHAKHWCHSSTVAISGWLEISKGSGNGISSLVADIWFGWVYMDFACGSSEIENRGWCGNAVVKVIWFIVPNGCWIDCDRRFSLGRTIFCYKGQFSPPIISPDLFPLQLDFSIQNVYTDSPNLPSVDSMPVSFLHVLPQHFV